MDEPRVGRGLSVLGALIAISLTHCAPAPRPAAASRASVPAPRARPGFRTLAEGEPALLALEDRRAFDRAVLERAAASSDAALRSRTAIALGRIGDERVRDLLRRLLTDSDADVRAAAAFGAAILGSPALTADLLPLLSDAEMRVAVRAAWSVGFLEQPTGLDALVAAIPAALAPELRAALLRALWRFSSPAAAAAARPHASDPDGRIRAAALYALTRRPQESSLPVLTAALADADAELAALSARALGVLGREESILPLAAAIDDRRLPVRIHAMTALAAILEKNPQASLPAGESTSLLALAGDANPNLAVPALIVLRRLTADREIFRRLWSVASTGEGRRRQVALQSLMAGLGEESESLVDAAIDSEDRFLRAAAAESLSFLPEGDAAPRRERLAADPEILVRLKVLEGLRTPEAVQRSRPLIEAALADPDAGVRAAAIEALARSEDSTTLPLILQALWKSGADREPDVPIAAIGAAEKRDREPAAREIVEAAYQHPNALASRLARRSLVNHFHADPATLPLREYPKTKEVSDYAALLEEAGKPWSATVETSRGAFRLRLAGREAPLTTINFVRLAQRGFFDVVVIHRVVPDFVVQDGDPAGTGNGGPGYEIRDEINPISYGEGSVGMALSGPDTGGSQWFVTFGPQPHLDGIYTLFGRVVSGMDVLKRVEQGDRIHRVTVSAERE